MNTDHTKALQDLLLNYENQLQEWQTRKTAFGGSEPAYIEDEIRSVTKRIEDLRTQLKAAGVSAPDRPAGSNTINTGGGSHIGGSVHTGGGDFVGRDKTLYGDNVYGDKIARDKIAGDKISVGDISGSQGIAIGRGAQSTVSSTSLTSATPDQFARLLQELRTALEAAALDSDEKEAVQQDLDKVTEQLAKPEPKLSLIRRGLNNVKDIIEAAVGLGATAPVLSSMVQRVLAMAQQLFR